MSFNHWSLPHPPYRKSQCLHTPVLLPSSPCFFSTRLACICTQSRPTLCDPMDCSPPGSSVHEISQARILEWVAISFSRRSSWHRNWTFTFCISCIGRWILYNCVTWEALHNTYYPLKYYTVTCLMFPVLHRFGADLFTTADTHAYLLSKWIHSLSASLGFCLDIAWLTQELAPCPQGNIPNVTF